MEDDKKITMKDVILEVKEQSLTKGDRWLIRTVLGILVIFMGWSAESRFRLSEQISDKADKTELSSEIKSVDDKYEIAVKALLPIKTYREIEKQRATDIVGFVKDVLNNEYSKDEQIEKACKDVETAMDDKIKLGTTNL